MVFKTSLAFKIMQLDYYGWKTIKGLLTIETNQQKPWLWDLCLDGTPIRRGYNDPNQAAFDANKSDVGDERINSILKKIYVPSDLSQWLQAPCEQFQNKQQHN